jgi:hypothetical protein
MARVGDPADEARSRDASRHPRVAGTTGSFRRGRDSPARVSEPPQWSLGLVGSLDALPITGSGQEHRGGAQRPPGPKPSAK